MPAMGTMARRALTPLLVVLVVAPPRVCTCEHERASASHVDLADTDHGDPPAPCHPHDPGPAGDPDCPCVQPAQLKATVPSGGATALAAAGPRPEFLAPQPPDFPALLRRCVDCRAGDPPLYLTGCALRF